MKRGHDKNATILRLLPLLTLPLKKLNTIHVAAAVLLDKGEMHAALLADQIIRTGLTTLGERGGTPERTVGSKLSQSSVFKRVGSGCYELRDPDLARNTPKIEEASERYQSWKTEQLQAKDKSDETDRELDRLRRKVKALQDRNKVLRKAMRDIADRCKELGFGEGVRGQRRSNT